MSLPLIDRRFVGDAWCEFFHIDLYREKKKQKHPCFALLVRVSVLSYSGLIAPWRSIAHLGARAGKKRRTPQGNQRESVSVENRIPL